MGFDFASIIGGNIGEAVARIVGLFKVDPTVALSKQVELQEIQLQLQSKLQDQIAAQIQAQSDTNKIEAASPKIFVSGWRPFIGWVCGVGLGIQFIVNPLFTWIAALAKHPVQFPSLDLGTLMTLLFGMLGLGAMRTYEKTNGAPGADQLQ
jgi:hypothetical protein